MGLFSHSVFSKGKQQNAYYLFRIPTMLNPKKKVTLKRLKGSSFYFISTFYFHFTLGITHPRIIRLTCECTVGNLIGNTFVKNLMLMAFNRSRKAVHFSIRDASTFMKQQKHIFMMFFLICYHVFYRKHIAPMLCIFNRLTSLA